MHNLDVSHQQLVRHQIEDRRIALELIQLLAELRNLLTEAADLDFKPLLYLEVFLLEDRSLMLKLGREIAVHSLRAQQQELVHGFLRKVCLAHEVHLLLVVALVAECLRNKRLV